MNLLWDAMKRQPTRRLWAPMLGTVGIHILGVSSQDASARPYLFADAADAVMHHFSPDILFPPMDIFLEVRALKQAPGFTVDRCALEARGLEALAQAHLCNLPHITTYYKNMASICAKYRQRCPTAAFVTAPFTLATLLAGTMRMQQVMLENPEHAMAIVHQATRLVREHITQLITRDCTLLCLLDPFASLLHCDEYQPWAGRATSEIVTSIHTLGATGILHICGNSSHIITAMAATGADALSLDSAQAGVDLPSAADHIPENCIIMGNLNPLGALLKASPEEVAQETRKLLASMENIPNFILSSGCELVAKTPFPNIKIWQPPPAAPIQKNKCEPMMC